MKLSSLQIKVVFGALSVISFLGYRYNQPPPLSAEQIQMQQQLATWGEAHKKAVEAEKCKSPGADKLPECEKELPTFSKIGAGDAKPKRVAPADYLPPVPVEAPPVAMQLEVAQPVVAAPVEQPQQSVEMASVPPMEEIEPEQNEVQPPIAPQFKYPSKSGPSIYLNMGTHTFLFTANPDLSNADLDLLKQKLKGMCLADSGCSKPIFSDSEDFTAYTQNLNAAKAMEWTNAGFDLVCEADSECPRSGKYFIQRTNSVTDGKLLLGFDAKVMVHRQFGKRNPASVNVVKRVYELGMR